MKAYVLFFAKNKFEKRFSPKRPNFAAFEILVVLTVATVVRDQSFAMLIDFIQLSRSHSAMTFMVFHQI